MPTKLGPKDDALVIKFGGGIHSRASEEDIDPRECANGQNFELDLQNRNWKPRKPIDLIGTVPNGGEIRGFVSLLKSDGTVSMLVQAEDVVYEWDGDSFQSVGSCAATAQLRGRISHNWLLDDKVIITDLNLQEPVSEWDGTTFQNTTFTGAAGDTVAVNGGFATDTDWTKGTGWTIASGKASCDGSQTDVSDLYQSVLVADTRYAISFTVSNYSQGKIRPQAGATNGTYVTSNGSYYEVLVCTTTAVFSMEADADFIGSIDDVVIQPIPDWNGELRAKYCEIQNERAIYGNIYDNGTTFPHMMVGSRTSYYNQISVSDRPSSALGNNDPFFLLTPDLRPINGMAQAYNVMAISSFKGSMFKLTGSNATDFDIDQLYRDSGASGVESVTYVGNDIMYGRQGRMESLSGTDRYGDVETDDLSNDIFDLIEDYDNWTNVYNARTQRIYCFPSGENEVWVLNKSLVGAIQGEDNLPLSPWTKYKTSHEMKFNITAMMNAYDPSDSLEYVYFGDANGNVYKMEGTTSGGDGGSATIKVERLSKLFTMPLDAEAFEIHGWVGSRKKETVIVNLRFEYQGYQIYNETTTVSLTPDQARIYYGGNNYYGGTFYYGTIQERFSRDKFGIAGSSNQFQIRATIESQNDFTISEIGLRFEVAS